MQSAQFGFVLAATRHDNGPLLFFFTAPLTPAVRLPHPRPPGPADAANRRIGAVRHELSSTHEKMDGAQAEAAALGSELLQTTAAAAAVNSAMRQLSIRT